MVIKRHGAHYLPRVWAGARERSAARSLGEVFLLEPRRPRRRHRPQLRSRACDAGSLLLEADGGLDEWTAGAVRTHCREAPTQA